MIFKNSLMTEDEDEILPNTTRYFRRPTNPFVTGIFNPLHTTRPIRTLTYCLSLSLFPNTTSFQNVVVYPTAEQINRATETLYIVVILIYPIILVLLFRRFQEENN